MKKDVWVTGYTSKHPDHGVGYGGLMARQGLAEAIFGPDRVLVLENELDPSASNISILESTFRILDDALHTHGEPRFYISGWQDVFEPAFALAMEQFPSCGIQKPTKIILIKGTEDIYEKNDLVIEPAFNTSDIANPKKVIMQGVPHRVNATTIATTKHMAYHLLPEPIKNQNFATLLVGAPQKDLSRQTLLKYGIELIQSAAELCTTHDLGLVVITSPRTPESLIDGIRSGLHQSETPNYLYKFTVGDPLNPYPGILGLPNNKLVFITKDSLSLMCEAVASPVPVVVDSPWPQELTRYQKLFDIFAERGFLLPRNHASVTSPDIWRQKKVSFNGTEETAKAVRMRLIRFGLAKVSDFPAEPQIFQPAF